MPVSTESGICWMVTSAWLPGWLPTKAHFSGERVTGAVTPAVTAKAYFLNLRKPQFPAAGFQGCFHGKRHVNLSKPYLRGGTHWGGTQAGTHGIGGAGAGLCWQVSAMVSAQTRCWRRGWVIPSWLDFKSDPCPGHPPLSRPARAQRAAAAPCLAITASCASTTGTMT